MGQRLNPIPLFDKLPPASLLRLPRPRYGERFYTRWLETAAPPAAETDAVEEIPTASETPPAEEELPAPAEDLAADDQSDDEETWPSEDDSAGKDAI